MKRWDVLKSCKRKRVRLGLRVGLGLQGETLGRLKLLHEKKGKVRVRVKVVR